MELLSCSVLFSLFFFSLQIWELADTDRKGYLDKRVKLVFLRSLRQILYNVIEIKEGNITII